VEVAGHYGLSLRATCNSLRLLDTYLYSEREVSLGLPELQAVGSVSLYVSCQAFDEHAITLTDVQTSLLNGVAVTQV
jgi:hypothetical protein